MITWQIQNPLQPRRTSEQICGQMLAGNMHVHYLVVTGEPEDAALVVHTLVGVFLHIGRIWLENTDLWTSKQNLPFQLEFPS